MRECCRKAREKSGETEVAEGERRTKCLRKAEEQRLRKV